MDFAINMNIEEISDMSRTISVDSDSSSNSECPSEAAVQHIGIVLYNGFSLLGVGTLAEALNIANDLQASAEGGCLTYRVSFLSDRGGIVTCSSSIGVCTERFDGGARTFDALYVAGGIGAKRALAHDELIELLGIACAQGAAVSALGSGHVLLTSASLSCDTCTLLGRGISAHDYPSHPRDERNDALLHTGVLLKLNLGDDLASLVIERLSKINTCPSC